MTDVVAKQIDRHPESDVYVFEVAGDLARELTFWSEPLRIKFDTGPDGRMWMLCRMIAEENAAK